MMTEGAGAARAAGAERLERGGWSGRRDWPGQIKGDADGGTDQRETKT